MGRLKIKSFWLIMKLSFLYNINIIPFTLLHLLQEGGPLQGPETALLSNTWKLIVRGDTCADKARDFIGKVCPAESSRVRESRRTALSRGWQFPVLWWWDCFWVVCSQSFWLRVLSGGTHLVSQGGCQQEGFWEVVKQLMQMVTMVPGQGGWW